MKTYQEFISEAKKCWPGYKKKGTQKLFGKTYNRCVKEGKIPWDDQDRPLRSGWTPREKNRAKRVSTGVENPEHSPSEKQLERYGKLKSAHDDQKNVKTRKDQRHKNPEDYGLGRRNLIVKDNPRMPSENQKGDGLYGIRRIPRNYSKGEDLDKRSYGAKNDEKRDEYYKKGPKGLKEPKESFDYSIDEAKSDSDLSKEQKVAVRNKRRGMNTVDRMMVHWDDRGEKKQRGEKESDWWKTKFVKDKSGKLSKYRDWHVTNQGDKRAKIEVEESWSEKYKKSIDCNNPKGFSQRAHCQGKKKKK